MVWTMRAIWNGAEGRRLANRIAKVRNHLGGDFHRGIGLELTADQSLVELNHDSFHPEPRLIAVLTKRVAGRGLARTAHALATSADITR